MREFAKGKFSLRQAPRRLRLIYAAFLLLVGVGIVTQFGFQVARIGVSPWAIAAYYRGGESGEVMVFPKTFGQLLEVTHAHAFVMAVVFLILAHLFVATSVSEWVKAAVISVTFAGTLGDILAPWCVRYIASWCAWITLASWIAQGAGTAVLILVSARACVGPGTESRVPPGRTENGG
jgi:hypothetical protein